MSTTVLNHADDPAVGYRTWHMVKDIGRFLRPYRRRFIGGSLARLAADLSWLYVAYGFGALVDFLVAYRSGGSPGSIQIVWVLLIAAIATRYAGFYIGKKTIFTLGQRLSLDAKTETINRLFRLDMAWHERENAGNKLKKIEKGGDAIEQTLRVWVGNIIEITVNFIGITIVVSSIDPRIGMMLLLFIAFYLPLSFGLLRKASAAAREVNIREEEVNGLFFEALNNIRSVKVMGMAAELGRRVQDMIGILYTTVETRIGRFQSRNTILGSFSSAFRVAGWMIIVYGVMHGRYEVGFLALFNVYFSSLRESVEELSTVSEQMVMNKNAMARMMAILKEPLTIDDEEGKVPFPRDWKVLKLDRVTFGYGDDLILKNVSFEVKRGEKVGVVGLSGAGKSTLFKLLFKERENYEGEISYDGVALRDISKDDYFRYVAAVLQETEVFNFSLRDNVTIANSAAAKDRAAFDKAVDIAHVNEFLHKLKQGSETLIGEKGVKLSGGEKQRLGIARAIFKSPQIFFLDEATSHLDLESEEKIQDSLSQFFKGVTAVVIAHRLTTIKEMDRILVLEDGEIVEQGSWSALMRAHGRFRELWDKQKL